MGLNMDIEAFKAFCSAALQQRKFQKLLQIPAFEDSDCRKYLEGRGFVESDFNGLNAFVFEGVIQYKDKSYTLPKSLIIALLDPLNGMVRGVWIRALHEKKFYIWMVSEETQKYWISPLADLTEPVIVCESILDAISFAKLTGNRNVAAALGVSVTHDLQDLLPVNSVLAFDNDRPGKLNMLKALQNNPKYGIIKHNLGLIKDFNEFLVTRKPLTFNTLYGVQAKIHLRSQL